MEIISWVRPPYVLKFFYPYSIWSCWLKQNILFSFDDGPSIHSSKLLDLAKEMNVKFAFFILPEQATKYPDIVKRMVFEGHIVGTHFMIHKNHFLYSHSKLNQSLQRSVEIIQQISNHKIKYCRSPYGFIAPWQDSWILKSGFNHVFWSLDSKDYKFESKNNIINRIKNNMKKNDIILLHDWDLENSNLVEIVKECLDFSLKKFKNYI